jgi:hypothetical protein
MRRATLLTCAVALIVLPAGASRATNPGSIEIKGLRLGMTATQVDTALLHQGILASRITRTASPCQEGRGCDVTVTAPTVDGKLAIRLVARQGDASADGTVERITYTLRGFASGEGEMITTSVLDRFGRPDQATPMTWCKQPTTDGICRPDQPLMRFEPESLTLTLSAGPTGELTK